MSPVGSPHRTKRTKRSALPRIAKDDSEELGDDDLSWQWVYADQSQTTPRTKDDGNSRKRKRTVEGERRIVSAKMGSLECKVGDTVLLKGDGSNEAWLGIICDFQDDEDGEKSANFMWFSSEREIRNKHKKRTDYLEVSCNFPR